jgi:hypothetical protein
MHTHGRFLYVLRDLVCMRVVVLPSQYRTLGVTPTVIPVCLRGVVRGAVHAVRSCVCLHAQTGLVGKPSVRSEVLGVHGGAV